jgi:galactokinase
VLDSGIQRSLGNTAYNERRDECQHAARLLNVSALRDAALDAITTLPPLLQQRARHVISENERVLRAAGGVNAAAFGELMNASHASLRDDYQVSTAGLDLLVELLQREPAVYGAKLTGAGFGGACVALCEQLTAREVAETVLAAYTRDGGNGRLLVPVNE